MKKIFITLIARLTLAGFLLAGCQRQPPPIPAINEIGDSQNPPDAGLRVLAVESFLADIAQNVAGDRLKVESLMPLGIDPHAFQPTPRDVAKIAESQLLVMNGAGLEEWLAETIENAGGERTLIEAAAGLTSREAREGEEAVMSPEEKAEQVCAELAEKTATEAVIAGTNAAGAAELHSAAENDGEHAHEMELITLKLNQQAGGFGGFVLLDAHEAGDYLIAAAAGNVAVLAGNGSPAQIEDRLELSCAGLAQGLVMELEAGEYTLSLSEFSSENTPFVAGPAGGHQHAEGDPHFWLDPLNVVKYAENIRDSLIAADPDGAEIYTRNAADYSAQLNELDGWIQQQVSAIPAERRLIVTNHESFGYFADRYGFQIIGTIIPSVSSGAAPSAQQMARLVDHIRETNAIAIFLETGSNPQLAQQIAQETGLKVVSELYSHSITAPDGKAPTYIDMMKYNVQAIVEALK